MTDKTIPTPVAAPERVQAPFTDEQVEALNLYQTRSQMHPFTCGGDRGDEAHRQYAAEHGGDRGQLVARTEGWGCPVPGCGYTQDWAHGFMANKEIVTELAQRNFRQFGGQVIDGGLNSSETGGSDGQA